MSQYRPRGRFKWLNRREIGRCDVNSVGENSIGYILKVDLECHNESHELHIDYPLASGKLKISCNTLPNYCSSIVNKSCIKMGGVNKLLQNLGNKSKHVLHYRNLQLYFLLGMKLVKFHEYLKFRQSDWLKMYIDFNKEKRKNDAKNFGKTFVS